MYLLTAVINNEEIVDDILTGWIDLGITNTTVIETTDSLQLISYHVPIFAGFRALASGGMRHNKTLFTLIEERDLLKLAIAFLENRCQDTGKPAQGIYFVTMVADSGELGSQAGS